MVAGLGESEFFYSFTIASLYIGSITGGFLVAFLIKFMPYWYLFIFFISAHILGFVLYGVASQGWMLILAMALVGVFTGSETILVFNYATDMSFMYVSAFKERGEVYNCDRMKAIEFRNYLYAFHSLGYSVGFIFATGQYIAIANMLFDSD